MQLSMMRACLLYTSSLFHVDGRLIKSVTKPYETSYPDAVRAEQNAEDLSLIHI